MAEMAPNPFPIVETEPEDKPSDNDTRPHLELVESSDRPPKLTPDEAMYLLGRGPYVARLRASRRILSIATAFSKDEQTTEIIGEEYLRSLRRDSRRAQKALSRYDSKKDEPRAHEVPQEVEVPAIGQQAVSMTTEVVLNRAQEDLMQQQIRLRQQAHRIIIARTRPDPFETDVRGGDVTKLSKDGGRIDSDNWGTFAECRIDHPDAMFVRGAEQNKAKALCAQCDVRRECLADALENQIEWGVWGGMSERERRALLRKQNWHNVFPPMTKPAPEPQESA